MAKDNQGDHKDMLMKPALLLPLTWAQDLSSFAV